MKKTKLRLLLFLVLLVLVATPSIYAQGGPDPPPFDDNDGPDPPPANDDDGPDPPPTAPINSAISYLALLGIGFVYKTYSKNNKN